MALEAIAMEGPEARVSDHVARLIATCSRGWEQFFADHDDHQAPRFVPSVPERVFAVLEEVTIRKLPPTRVFCEWGSGFGTATSDAGTGALNSPAPCPPTDWQCGQRSPAGASARYGPDAAGYAPRPGVTGAGDRAAPPQRDGGRWDRRAVGARTVRASPQNCPPASRQTRPRYSRTRQSRAC